MILLFFIIILFCLALWLMRLKFIIKSNNCKEVVEEEIINIKLLLDVKDKKIIYNLDSYSCYMIKKGQCSLSIPDPMEEEERMDANFCRSYYYCKRLAKHMLEHEVPKGIIIGRGENEVYYVTDGQHRLCIAQQLELIVPVYLSLPKSKLQDYKNAEIINF